MTGHVRRRGAKSWEIKFDAGTDPGSGKRITRYHSFKGTKREAEAKLAELITALNRGQYVDPSKTTVAEFLNSWEADWAPGNVSPKTLERYKELLAHHVRPHIGASRMQRLRTADLAELYGRLLRPRAEGGGGLAPRTVGHVHRLLHRALGHAVKWQVIATNPAASADPPRVQRTEIDILEPHQIKTVLDNLRERTIYPIVVLAMATGMRRGELCALRWCDVDFDGGKVRVTQSLEQTNAGLRFKEPKTDAGRRVISIPPSIAAELRGHWKSQQEQRLTLGLGRASPGDLVFVRPDLSAWPPDSLTQEWARLVRTHKLPGVTLHALRHTHASQLIAGGMDVVTVSRRLGHNNPSVTLKVYAHLFGTNDDRASAIVESAMAGLLTAHPA